MEQNTNGRAPFRNIINAKLIAYVIGILTWVEGGLLLLCMAVSLLYHEDDYIYFLYATGINVLVGGCLTAYGKGADTWMTRRDGYCIVSLTWVIFTLLGMVPFLLSGDIPSVAGAFFETMSGFTTTGFTVVDHLDTMSKGMLFWRALTQWVGGLGIVCFTIALLPIFGGGNLQLFSAEATGVTHDKLHPKISMTTKLIWTVYIILTSVCTVLLWVGGMNVFDSVCHAFSIMGTGGFSTKQASITYWNSPFIEYVTSIFMILASLNFSLLVLCLMAALTWMASMRDGYVAGVDYWKVMLLCTTVFAAYVVFKFIIYRLVCWAFYDAAGTKQWMDDYMTLLSYNGFMLFVLALAGVYFNISIHTLRHLATGLLICDKLLIVYKLSRLFFRPKIGRLTFFLQLCTLEILPCFILNEVLLEINIIFE